MGLFDFFKPNVEKLEKKRNIRGLVKALRYKKDQTIRKKAAEALRNIADEKTVDGLIYSVENEWDNDIKLISITALDKIPSKKAVPALIKCLGNREHKIRKAALEALKKNADGSAAKLILDFLKTTSYAYPDEAGDLLLHITGPSEFDVLKNALEDRKTRRYAAKALGKTGNAMAVDLLLPLLEDKDSLVRRDAAYGLGDTRDKRALEPLLKLIKDKTCFVSGSAITALGKIGDPKANDELISLLKSYSTKEDKAVLVAEALANTGGQEAVKALISAYDKWKKEAEGKYTSNKAEKWQVVTSVSKAIDKLIDEASPEVRAEFAVVKQDKEMIKAMGAASILSLLKLYQNYSMQDFADEMIDIVFNSSFFQNKSEEEKKVFLERAIPVLLRVINDNNFNKSHDKARKMLDLLGAPAVHLLIPYLQAKDYRYIASSALGRIGGAAAEPLILALKDNNPEVRASAVMALGNIRSKLSAEALINLLNDKENKVVEEALTALGKIKDERSVVPLISLAEDSNDVHIKNGALKALGDIGDKRGTDVIISKLGNDYVRNTAVSALGEMGDKKALEPLLFTLNHSDEETRKLSAYALGKLKDEKSVKPLCELVKDSHASVREAAVKALKEIASPEALDSFIKALSDEDDSVRKAAVEGLELFDDVKAAKPLFDFIKKEKTGSVYPAKKILDKLCDRAELEVQAGYAVYKKDWNKAVSLGKVSVEPLIEHLSNERLYIDEAADALEKLGVPSDSKSQAFYLIAKRKWSDVGRLGEEAAEPLLKVIDDSYYKEEILSALGETGSSKAIPRIKGFLYSGEKNMRQAAARALSSIYRRGKLEEKDKQAILELKGHMEKKHEDHTFYSDCNDHKDNMGIGVYL